MRSGGRRPEAPDAAVRDTVNRCLDAIEREEGVRVLFACESGSRAWGFASPDSDYDVRFVYVQPRDWYLSIGDQRDVIERPIVDLYDVSGWDLRKALRLFRKSNPPMLEWLGSPIVYRERTTAAASLRRIAARSFSPRACAFHYLHMARGNYREYLQADALPLKKYLYVLRPLLAGDGVGSVVRTTRAHLATATRRRSRSAARPGMSGRAVWVCSTRRPAPSGCHFLPKS